MYILLWLLASITVYVGSNKEFEEGVKVVFFAVVALIVVLYIVTRIIL